MDLVHDYIRCLKVNCCSVASFVGLFATPRTPAHQASLSITNSQSLLKLMSIESVLPSNHLILCHPLLLLFSMFPSIRVFFFFSNELALHIWWPKYEIVLAKKFLLTTWTFIIIRPKKCICKSFSFRYYIYLIASLVAQMVKNLPAIWETPVQFLGKEDLLEIGMTTHSNTLA